ncbi:acylneuraminate cytidylyltransferase family protein [Leptospira yasudae]|uniref:acylneuraminate cytidylyltransferase family protein n=1 Tax=Leptospira yasudae TaxID=2202201 RepID=UPI001083709E|nr:acylneuraminate cytidylyltransferase family protein [Leptospira yasudae]TGK24497.1 acylneuraminate cytidylyltransferase family protein [Leptospira yasudae]TGM05717.1 acylneuraminate cytidylyltransferase family protein [Leptospira yasudae]
MKVLGVIVARGGSKGVPGKNLKQLGGIPLIRYSIDAAKNSKKLTDLLVSTDSNEIAEYAKSCGVNVPFIRPNDLADDVISPMYAVLHAKKFMESQGKFYDAILMLQPTAPFRKGDDIDGAISLLESSGSDSVISVVDVGSYHPARMKYLEGDRLIDPPFCEAYENQRRQELKPMYIRNGAIYLTKSPILEGESFKGKDCRAWVMSWQRSVNIDTQEDFLYAEWLSTRGLID